MASVGVCASSMDMRSLFSVKKICACRLRAFAWRAPSRADTVRLSLSPAAVGAPQSVGHSAVLLSHLLVATRPHAPPSASSAPACAYRSAFGSLAPGLNMHTRVHYTKVTFQKILVVLGN